MNPYRKSKKSVRFHRNKITELSDKQTVHPRETILKMPFGILYHVVITKGLTNSKNITVDFLDIITNNTNIAPFVDTEDNGRIPFTFYPPVDGHVCFCLKNRPDVYIGDVELVRELYMKGIKFYCAINDYTTCASMGYAPDTMMWYSWANFVLRGFKIEDSAYAACILATEHSRKHNG